MTGDGIMKIATEDQITELRRRAVNDVTREIMKHGIMLTHDQADDLGDETIAWIGGRLCLNVTSTDSGVECTPPVHYVGTDENGDWVTAGDVYDEAEGADGSRDSG